MAGGRMLVLAIAVFCGAPFVVMCGQTKTVLGVVLALTTWGLFKGFYDSNIFASVFDAIPPEARGTVAGFMNTVGWLGGGTAPLSICHLAEREGLGLAISAAAVVYVAAGIFLAIGVLAFARQDVGRMERRMREEAVRPSALWFPKSCGDFLLREVFIRKRKVGLLTFTDGRKFAHDMLREMNFDFQNKFRARLESTGEYEVVAGDEIVWHPEVAKREGRRLREAGVEATILNYAVWCFPHLTLIATEFAPGPYLLFSNINPRYPGMVGMLAAAGGMDQVGRYHERVTGDIGDHEVFARVQKFLRAAVAVSRLKGETFGLYGGRPMGMYTAVADAAQWKRDFGIDVEHIDQYEIIRRAEMVDKDRVENAFAWLEKHLGKNIHYDGKKLTPELLKRQIASYYACLEINSEKGIDFFGVKAQPELTDHFTTEDVIDAFSNDPYDWDGPKEPVVCATEADMDGALTMELFKHITGEPVLFADVRHYDAGDNFFDLCNSGAHATFFAGRSRRPEDNLPKVHFWPEIFYFPAGGASVMHFAQPGEVTLARLTRRDGKYWMAIVPAEFILFDEKKNWAKAEATTKEWPHAFARLKVPADEFLASYDSNHTHGCYGNWVDELVAVSKLLKIDYHIYA